MSNEGNGTVNLEAPAPYDGLSLSSSAPRLPREPDAVGLGRLARGR
ncbi:MAG TPA: hypothetical protein VNA27_09770 [Rubrobacteraceae bacterium]|jgi:hypothetical protein|nr:hypothetical protein [Rubrobacteraceae bacterium]